MILPIDNLPKYSLYYIGGLILKTMENNVSYNTSKLFDKVKENEEISYKLFVLAIDWLFIINAIKITNEGGVHYVYKAINYSK